MQVEVQDVGTFKRLRKNVAIKWYLFACLRLSQHTMVALLARLDYEWFQSFPGNVILLTNGKVRERAQRFPHKTQNTEKGL